MLIIPFTKRLSTRLAAYVIVIAVSLGLFFSFVQIYLDYFNVQDQFDNSILQVLNTLEKPATQALYQVDEVLADEVVQGLMEFKPIRKVRLLNENQQVFAEASRPLASSRWQGLSLFWLPPERRYSRPLHEQYHQVEKESMSVHLFDDHVSTAANTGLLVGILNVDVDNALLMENYWQRAFMLILSGIMRNLLLALALLYLFHWLINKPLLSTTQALAAIDPQSPGESALACPPNHNEDELCHLIDTANTLLRQINIKVKEQRYLLQDMGEAKQDAEAANVAKSQFMAKMSHELRTPLNAVIGYSEMLEDELEEISVADAKTDIAQIKQAGERLLVLVDNILDLSKIESGEVIIQKQILDLNSFVRNLIGMAQVWVEEKGNEISCHCDDDKQYVYYTDKERLQQNILHLIHNACKYTQKGKLHIHAEYQQIQTETWLLFRVTDNGIGIPKGQQRAIFESFCQVDDSYSRSHEGGGLGLTIIKRTTELMGGEIHVNSTLGEGSCFTLSVPVERVKRLY